MVDGNLHPQSCFLVTFFFFLWVRTDISINMGIVIGYLVAFGVAETVEGNGKGPRLMRCTHSGVLRRPITICRLSYMGTYLTPASAQPVSVFPFVLYSSSIGPVETTCFLQPKGGGPAPLPLSLETVPRR